jgi:dTDP-4-dehydrorhamnose 3,5-epimerase
MNEHGSCLSCEETNRIVMRVTKAESLPDVVIIEPTAHTDERGYFLELFHEARYHGIVPARFVQDNLSVSHRGVLRGLHYQLVKPQGKLVSVLEGEIFDVAVDIRRGSPTFGAHAECILSAGNHRQVYIPEGFAHGFCVTGERALVLYKCTASYDPAGERGIRWDDPSLAIQWPVAEPILSERDRNFPVLEIIPKNELPVYDM